MKYILSLSLILWVVIYRCAGQLNITGNEQPLTIGLSRNITCTWSGGNVTTMEWFLVGLGAGDALERVSDARSVLLTLNPGSDGLDGAMFTCRASFSNGDVVEESIAVMVEEIVNIVSITSTPSNATAGQPYTLICTAISERLSELSWIDPNGVACPQDDPGMTVTHGLWSGQTSTLELTFTAIRTSQSGVYKCISSIIVPTSKSEASFLVQVQIPGPTVEIFRTPEHPVQLFTTDSLMLMCVIELVPEVDSYVTVNSRWSGHSSLTDRERRVIVSDLKGVQLTYNTTVTFNTLKSSDSGSYVCSATVTPLLGSRNQMQSPRTEARITISVVLKVTIEVTYSPPSDFTLPTPPYYRPATSVTLTCHAHHAAGTVSYRWSSTCSSCFASSSTSQLISDSILQANDAGVHTCTATDSSSNTGSDSTEIKLSGIGLYVATSYYTNAAAVSNNSLVVVSSYCRYCSSRALDVYCYSNTTSTSGVYFKFPNGRRYSSSGNYNYNVERQTYGVRIHVCSSYHYYCSSPSIWGIFTCEEHDGNGIRAEASIGIYSSRPSAPSIYSIRFKDWSNVASNVLGIVECLTQNSPPKTVTWTRDGKAVDIDGIGYEIIQSVTERQSYSRYNNSLVIRNAAELAGDHNYCCSVSNSAGSTSRCVATSWTVQPDLTLATSETATNSDPFKVTCRASLQPIVAAHLIQYMTVNWTRTDGQLLDQEDMITVAEQQTLSTSVIQTVTFDPLSMTHGGDYTCEAILILPDSAGEFNTSQQYHLNVLNRTLIQLKFGPVVHCSKWYEDKHMARHLESDIKHVLASLVNENCSCDFQTSQIDQGEFSCRFVEQGYVIYRARLTGSSDTLSIPPLLELISDWILEDGTFLYTYNGNLRLGLDRDCSLEIASFSQPECKHSKTDLKTEL